MVGVPWLGFLQPECEGACDVHLGAPPVHEPGYESAFPLLREGY